MAAYDFAVDFAVDSAVESGAYVARLVAEVVELSELIALVNVSFAAVEVLVPACTVYGTDPMLVVEVEVFGDVEMVAVLY